MTPLTTALLLLVLFQLKHFVFDFTKLQTPWMFLNKGTYGHPGGIAHAALHAMGTFLILAPLIDFNRTVAACAGEFLIHYHMDWFKVWVNKRKDWRCDRHAEFWTLLGIDQLVHQLTYIAIVWWLL